MSARGGKRVLSYDERVLWTTITQTITPLHRHASEPDESGDGGPQPEPKPKKVAARSRVLPSAPAPAAKPSPPPLAPLGRKMRQRVARGRESIDARLDLHGLTQAEAHATLSRFLQSAAARGARLVLVITGKGRTGGGVLRRHVPMWLALPEFRELVVGFEDAHLAHGGEGALYVRLRRR